MTTAAFPARKTAVPSGHWGTSIVKTNALLIAAALAAPVCASGAAASRGYRRQRVRLMTTTIRRLAAACAFAAQLTTAHAATVYVDAWCSGYPASQDHELNSAACSAGFGDSASEASGDGSVSKSGVYAAVFGSQNLFASAEVTVEDAVTYSGPATGPVTLKPTFYVHGATYEANTRGEVRLRYANEDSLDAPKIALDDQLNGPGVDKS